MRRKGERLCGAQPCAQPRFSPEWKSSKVYAPFDHTKESFAVVMLPGWVRKVRWMMSR